MNHNPMLWVDDLLDKLGGAKYLTTLDLAHGYWQVPMEKELKSPTGFTPPFGLYQCKIMLFGLSGNPAIFQRLMISSENLVITVRSIRITV